MFISGVYEFLWGKKTLLNCWKADFHALTFSNDWAGLKFYTALWTQTHRNTVLAVDTKLKGIMYLRVFFVHLIVFLLFCGLWWLKMYFIVSSSCNTERCFCTGTDWKRMPLRNGISLWLTWALMEKRVGAGLSSLHILFWSDYCSPCSPYNPWHANRRDWCRLDA